MIEFVLWKIYNCFATCDQIVAGMILCCCVLIVPKFQVQGVSASSGPVLVHFLYHFFENNIGAIKNNNR